MATTESDVAFWKIRRVHLHSACHLPFLPMSMRNIVAIPRVVLLQRVLLAFQAMAKS